MRSRRPRLLIVLCLALALLSGFWALGLTATPIPSELTLRVPHFYPLARNTVWSAGALFLAAILFTGQPFAPAACGVGAITWLIWSTADKLIFQAAPPGWLSLVLPALLVLAMIGSLFLPGMKAWFRDRSPS